MGALLKKEIEKVINRFNHPSLSIFLKDKGYIASIINVNKEYLIHEIKSPFPASFGIKTKSKANNMIAPTSLIIPSLLLLGFSKLTYFPQQENLMKFL